MLCIVKVNKCVSSLLQMLSDFAILTLIGIAFQHWGTRTEKNRDFAKWALFALTNAEPASQLM